ncbi:hypothetical protein [Gulosibacter sp. 10]|uniref:hypothetical protein n=1 Tax=Gulosibacter sp. 10 TaxID=1255570 RepID=UPI0011219F1F|nr:hypothetical protein [Gulosibacter sp. 10]
MTASIRDGRGTAAVARARAVARPRGIARWGAVVPLAILAAVCTGIALGARLPWFFAGAAASLLFALWWACLASNRCEVAGDEVRLSGPLWRRRIPLDAIRSIQVVADDGLNHGLLNWPVVSVPGGVRLNMGGRAAVRFLDRRGRRVEFVTADRAAAERLAAALGRDDAGAEPLGR